MAIPNTSLAFLAGAATGVGTFFDEANSYIGVGDGTDAFIDTQTDLVGTNQLRKKVDPGYPIVTGAEITYRATFAPSEANFAWQEWGVFNNSAGGVMLCRVLESNGTKQNNQTWVLEVTLSLENA